MKRVYIGMLAAALGVCSMGAQTDSEIKVTYEDNKKAAGFDFFQGGTKLSQDVATYADGHMTVTMAMQDEATNKHRADIWYNNGSSENYKKTVNPSKTAVLAIKFIGDKPVLSTGNSFQMEWLGEGFSGKINPTGNLTTSNGNNIYYWDLSKFSGYDTSAESAQLNRFHFIIADCLVEPFEYTVDWICSFESVDALTAAKDWKDDGDADMDEYVTPKVKNETTGKEYQDLMTAWNEAESGAVLNVLENQTITDLWATVDNVGRVLTVKGDGNVVITRKSGHNGMLFGAGAGSEINLENLVIDGGGVTTANVSIEANKGKINLKDVKLHEVYSIHDQGIICMKGDGGAVTLENVTAEGCVVKEGRGEMFCGNGNLVLKGDNNVSVYLESTYRFSVENLTNKERINIILQNPTAMDLVLSYQNVSRFVVMNEGWTLKVNEKNNIALCEDNQDTPAYAPMIEGDDATQLEMAVKEGAVLHIAGVKGCHVWYRETAMDAAAQIAVVDAVVNDKEEGWKEVEADEFDYVVPANIKSVEFKSVKNNVHSESAVLTIPGGSTGVENVEAAAAEGEVEWFTLQGVKIANPENGIYIRRQGSRVEKVVYDKKAD